MYKTIEEDFKTLNTAACVLHPKYQEALKRVQKSCESIKTCPKCGDTAIIKYIDDGKYGCEICGYVWVN